MFSHKVQKIWIYLYPNKYPNDSLINRCHSKMILGHAVFQLLSGSTFSLKLSLLLNNSISWKWLLFCLIKAKGKHTQVIKLRQQLFITS